MRLCGGSSLTTLMSRRARAAREEFPDGRLAAQSPETQRRPQELSISRGLLFCSVVLRVYADVCVDSCFSSLLPVDRRTDVVPEPELVSHVQWASVVEN